MMMDLAGDEVMVLLLGMGVGATPGEAGMTEDLIAAPGMTGTSDVGRTEMIVT